MSRILLEEEGRTGGERVEHSQTGKEGTKGSSASAMGGNVMTRSDWLYLKAAALDSVIRYVCIHAGGKEEAREDKHTCRDGARGWG